jgi:undecaprenyl diphosphate synthase
MISSKKKRMKSFNSSPAQALSSLELDPEKLPVHVAIIMDGNGRWAKKRFLNRITGHKKGAEAVRAIVRTSRELGIRILTLFAFSTENWQRPEDEIAALMGLLNDFLKSERPDLIKNNIRLNAIGQTGRLPREVMETLRESMRRTEENSGMILNLALSYGSRAEIVEMVKEIAGDVKEGRLNPSDIDESTVSERLSTRGMTDPDLLIRTSGEMRISNFLLWQIAYAEIFFTETLWPDFGKDEFVRILSDYQKRERRFGKTAS